MKRCPECRRDYQDDSLLYCLDDGAALVEGPLSPDEAATAILSDSGAKKSRGGAHSKDSVSGNGPCPDLSENETPYQTSKPATQSSARFLQGPYVLAAAILLILASAAGFGAWYFGFRAAKTVTRNTRFP